MLPWQTTRKKGVPIIPKPNTSITHNVPAPEGKTYLDYQLEGINYALNHTGTIIADEPGLGKTIQAIGVINSNTSISSVLIVCPASLKLNWRNELDSWLTRFLPVAIFPNVEGQIVIINYESLHKLPKYLMSPDLLILDEAHYIKNEKSKRTNQVKIISKTSKSTLALTGTPILNRPREIWTLLQVSNPEYWDPAISYGGKSFGPGDGGNFFRFGKRYCAAFKQHIGSTPCNATRGKCSACHWDFSGASNLDELQTKLKESCMIRRLKSDVLTELPEKRRQIIQLEAVKGCGGLPSEYDGIDDYDVLVKKMRSDKVLFEQISTLRHDQGLAKVNAVISHIEALIEEGIEKIVLFAHHRDVILALGNALRHHGLVTVTGETDVKERQMAVGVFQDDPNCKLFLGSIGAAGVGITLHASAHVVFAEMDWVPGIMTQAEDRCHRIGQKSSVLVQHLVLDGSIDARMCKMLIKKQEVINAAVG
jgi:SWI/SNF-related matrix-associated actin-dependent regulator 1 of chromatin subfamily A